eukprot:6485003-Amphidinium_carterae.1
MRSSMAGSRWHLYEYIGSSDLVMRLEELLEQVVSPLAEMSPKRALQALCEKVILATESLRKGTVAETYPTEPVAHDDREDDLVPQQPHVELDFDEIVDRELDPLLAQEEEDMAAEE